MTGTGRTGRRKGGLLGPQDYSERVAYRPPSPGYARLNRRLGSTLARLGWTPRDVVALEVRGRRSGTLRTTPLVLTTHGDGEYLVALAGESEWVRNVRAADGCAVIRRWRSRPVRLEELPVERRAHVIAAYLDQAAERGGAKAARRQAQHYFGLANARQPSDVEHLARYYPVFRVHDRGSAGNRSEGRELAGG